MEPAIGDPLVNALRSARRSSLDAAEGVVAAGLAAGRLAIGAGIWLAPRPTLRALGLGELDAAALTLARIAATRDLALGAWMASAAGDRRALQAPAVAVTACDGGDALAFALLARRGGDAAGAGLRGLSAAAPATVAGLWLLKRLREA